MMDGMGRREGFFPDPEALKGFKHNGFEVVFPLPVEGAPRSGASKADSLG